MTPPQIAQPDLSYLDPGDGRRIAIRSRSPADPKLPTVLFLPGYASDMEGQKAVAIDHFCASRGLGCLRLDYSGTGSSAVGEVAGLLGIAAAPDFTDWGYSADDKVALLRDGKLERANPYGPEPSVTHRGFWQSGEAMRLLALPVDIAVPVRLLCGEKDAEVPIGVSLKLVEQLRSADVQMKLIKNSGHRLSEPHEIHAILVELQGLVEIAKL